MLQNNPFKIRQIFKYLLQGVMVAAPVLVTFYILFSLVSYIDGLIPLNTYVDAAGKTRVQNYGLGIVVLLLLLILVGYISYFFITNRLIVLFDKIMHRLPGVNHIYSTAKDFLEAFAGEKRKFTVHVLANVDDNDVWRVGFITNQDMSDFGLEDYIAVYIPISYSIAGNVYIIPRNRVKPITHISSAQAMKFAVSGGITDVDEETPTA
jgi:uncharacterized membrane protein